MVTIPIRRRVLVSGFTAIAAAGAATALGASAMAATAAGHRALAAALWGTAVLTGLASHLATVWRLAEPWRALPEIVSRLSQESPVEAPQSRAPLWERARLWDLREDPVGMFAAHVSRASARLGQLAPRLEAAVTRLGTLHVEDAQALSAIGAAGRQAEACLQRASAQPSAALAARARPAVDGSRVDAAFREVEGALTELEARQEAARHHSLCPDVPEPQAAGVAEACLALGERQATLLGSLSVPTAAWASALSGLEDCLASTHALVHAPSPPGGPEVRALGAALQRHLGAGRAAHDALGEALAAAASDVAEVQLAVRTHATRAGPPAPTPSSEAPPARASTAPLRTRLQALRQAVTVSLRGLALASEPAGLRPPAAMAREVQQARDHVAAMVGGFPTLEARRTALNEALADLQRVRDDLGSITAPRPAVPRGTTRSKSARHRLAASASQRLPAKAAPRA